MKIEKNDVTIIGAGIAGICSALAASRHGLNVALINDRPVLIAYKKLRYIYFRLK